MAVKKINDYMPKHVAAETTLVQAKIDKSLCDQFNLIRKKNKITWHDFIVGAMRMYVDENKAAK